MAWIDVADGAEAETAGRLVVRAGGRQILLTCTPQGLFATANRCPHEGYPLSEGTLQGCTLTCNWHNWKFDLASGETLVGGDRLRRYPVRTEAGRIWLDLAEPPAAERTAKVLDGLIQALHERDQQRLVRETARLDRTVPIRPRRSGRHSPGPTIGWNMARPTPLPRRPTGCGSMTTGGWALTSA